MSTPVQASVAPSREKGQGYYSPALDGLRFCAALLVFVHHAPRIGPIGFIKDYGWLGVDLFLSISAFLITRLIMLEHERTGSISFRAFFIRRALRIWPLYLSYATAMCVLTLLLYEVEPIAVTAWWLSHLSFTNNVMTALEGYSPVLFSSHLWTISLEEQAYILMPLILSAFLLAKASSRAAIIFCGVALIILIVARTGFLVAEAPHPFVWVLPLRADAFLLGSLAAILLADPLRRPPRATALVGLLLLLSVSLFPPVAIASAYHIFGYTLVACGCTALVIGSQRHSLWTRLLSSGPMRYLGKISYGFYVYHLISIAIAIWTVRRLGLDERLAFPLGFIATVAIAALSYRLLERPFLLLKERYAVVSSRPV